MHLVPRQPVPVERTRPGHIDDQIGARQQRPQAALRIGGGRVDHHAALVGVVRQKSAASKRPVGAGGPDRLVSQRVARRAFHLHHVGTEVGEHLGAVAARHPLTQLDHGDVAEHAAHQTSLPAPAATTSARSSGKWQAT